MTRMRLKKITRQVHELKRRSQFQHINSADPKDRSPFALNLPVSVPGNFLSISNPLKNKNSRGNFIYFSHLLSLPHINTFIFNVIEVNFVYCLIYSMNLEHFSLKFIKLKF